MIAVKFIQVNLYNLYVDLERHLSNDQFQSFLVRLKSNTLPIVWYPEPITQMDYVAFCFKEQFYMLHKTNKCTKVVSMVTKEDWAILCQDVKNKCIFVTKGLIMELDRRF